jgi:hypothetical protein
MIYTRSFTRIGTEFEPSLIPMYASRITGNLNVFAHTISFIFDAAFFHQLLLLPVESHSSILDRESEQPAAI